MSTSRLAEKQDVEKPDRDKPASKEPANPKTKDDAAQDYASSDDYFAHWFGSDSNAWRFKRSHN